MFLILQLVLETTSFLILSFTLKRRLERVHTERFLRNFCLFSVFVFLSKKKKKKKKKKVYKAKYFGRDVAVKSMALLKDERERNWMKREISLLKQVRHPNVTEFIGISKDPGFEFSVFCVFGLVAHFICKENNLLIVMEFVPGGELYPLLQKEDLEIDWPLRLKIAHDVASALAFMHQRNIIHRDIVSDKVLFFRFLW